MKIITIGLDISKSVFQVYAEDGAGAVVLQKRLRRGQVEPFFAKLAAVADRHRGVRLGALLGTDAAGAGARGAAASGRLREAVCPSQQDRCA